MKSQLPTTNCSPITQLMKAQAIWKHYIFFKKKLESEISRYLKQIQYSKAQQHLETCEWVLINICDIDSGNEDLEEAIDKCKKVLA